MNTQKMLEDYTYQLLKTAPRLNILSSMFEKIAAGQELVPLTTVKPNSEWLNQNSIAIKIYDQLKHNTGVFNGHAYASIPYVLENTIRIMTAVHMYAQCNLFDQKNPLHFFEPGGGAGDITRVLPKFSNGIIRSLCSSATKANKEEFEKLKSHQESYFFSGAYFLLRLDYIAKHTELNIFRHGFDIIYEQNTFQMYAKNRIDQVKLLVNNFRGDGILILEEKCLDEDPVKFARLELLKDQKFKSLYFSVQQIDIKQQSILNEMNNGIVTLNELTEAISHNLSYAFLIWQSANFHTIIASNSLANLTKFIAFLMPAFVPNDLRTQDKLPKQLLGEII